MFLREKVEYWQKKIEMPKDIYLLWFVPSYQSLTTPIYFNQNQSEKNLKTKST